VIKVLLLYWFWAWLSFTMLDQVELPEFSYEHKSGISVPQFPSEIGIFEIGHQMRNSIFQRRLLHIVITGSGGNMASKGLSSSSGCQNGYGSEVICSFRSIDKISDIIIMFYRPKQITNHAVTLNYGRCSSEVLKMSDKTDRKLGFWIHSKAINHRKEVGSFDIFHRVLLDFQTGLSNRVCILHRYGSVSSVGDSFAGEADLLPNENGSSAGYKSGETGKGGNPESPERHGLLGGEIALFLFVGIINIGIGSFALHKAGKPSAIKPTRLAVCGIGGVVFGVIAVIFALAS